MKKIFIFILFCFLLSITSISAQITWDSLKGVKLSLVKYGYYLNGEEQNVFEPSSANSNIAEYWLLKPDGTFIWGNSGDGTNYLTYTIEGNYCYFNRFSKRCWVRMYWMKDNILFTVDNNDTYRYFRVGINQSYQNDSQRTTQSNNTNGQIEYLDVLSNFSSYDKIKEDFGKVVKTSKEEHSSQTIYRYFYDSGWEKILSVSKETCFMCGGDGKLHNWYMNFPPPSNVCNRCKGTGKELPSVIAIHNGKNYIYLESGDKRYVQNSIGGYNGSSNVSGGSVNTRNNSSSHSSNRCKYCGGGGGCSSCKGTGHKFNSYSGHEDTCPSCNGSGRCQICRGTGRL